MNFITDKQTQEDLNLLGKYKPQSLFSVFNTVKTGGGERLLQEMFEQPMTDPERINQRSRIFQYLHDKDLVFPVDPQVFHGAENYLSMGTSGNRVSAIFNVITKKFSAAFLHGDQFQRLHTGLLAAVDMLKSLQGFWDAPEKWQAEDPCWQARRRFQTLVSDKRLERILRSKQALQLLDMARCDYLLRHTLKKDIDQLLLDIYHLDVWIAVAQTARSKNLFYAKALPKQRKRFTSTALWHPAIEKAVTNPLYFNEQVNLLFLTGANMAGKSTLMKAFGVAMYLAHMGFPVAAKDMEFSVKDGIYSSINLPDDLESGLSHFYAEVLRVKKVATEVASGKDLVVIFDELFKGTNVKDAFDGTLMVTQALARYKRCIFVVSTHITEVGEALAEKVDSIKYAYLPTEINGAVPHYTYQLREGITADRQGMTIIRNEGILELLQKSQSRQSNRRHHCQRKP